MIWWLQRTIVNPINPNQNLIEAGRNAKACVLVGSLKSALTNRKLKWAKRGLRSNKLAPDWFGCGRVITSESWKGFLAARAAYYSENANKPIEMDRRSETASL